MPHDASVTPTSAAEESASEKPIPLAEWVASSGPVLPDICRRYTRYWIAADEIHNGAIARIKHAVPDADTTKSPARWMGLYCMSARSEFLDALRKRRAKKRAGEILETDHKAIADERDCQQYNDRLLVETHVTEIHNDERFWRALYQIVPNLSSTSRAFIEYVKKYTDNGHKKTLKEIGAQFGRSASWAHTMIHVTLPNEIRQLFLQERPVDWEKELDLPVGWLDSGVEKEANETNM